MIHESSNWYLSAKYALYVTWAFEGPVPGVHSACGCYPDGRHPPSFNEMANAFDVRQFVDDCVEMGVEYVNFTAYHAHMYVLYPSQVLASRLPGHTSDRDVIRELIDGLHSKGIRFQVYIHATIGDTMTEEERAALQWYDETGHFRPWNDFFNDFFAEMAGRYGRDIDSYYIDMIFDQPFLDMIDRPRLLQTLKSVNPDVVVVGNGESNEAVDYGSREDCGVTIAHVEARLAYPCQTVVNLSRTWWSTVPQPDASVARYTPEHLFRLLVLTAGANFDGGGLAIGASPYVTRGFEPGIKETIVALGRLIDPVAESLKNTYPSLSYITAGGAAIPALVGGITATRSADGSYEYLHVLVPPQGHVLRLGAPRDGKRFSSAVMLRTGHCADFTQDDAGITITVPDSWDPLDTIIRLKVAEVPEAEPFASAAIPDALISAAADSESPGHQISAVLDGDQATIWQSSSDIRHWITLDLGGRHQIHRVRVLPRQDGISAKILQTHISIYSIYASQDGKFFLPVATGEWKRTLEEKAASFPPVLARVIRIETGPSWLPHRHVVERGMGVASAARITVDEVRE